MVLPLSLPSHLPIQWYLYGSIWAPQSMQWWCCTPPPQTTLYFYLDIPKQARLQVLFKLRERELERRRCSGTTISFQPMQREKFKFPIIIILGGREQVGGAKRRNRHAPRIGILFFSSCEVASSLLALKPLTFQKQLQSGSNCLARSPQLYLYSHAVIRADAVPEKKPDTSAEKERE